MNIYKFEEDRDRYKDGKWAACIKHYQKIGHTALEDY
jgi:hypothetical protein